MEWYEIKNIDKVDSPALLIYKERVKHNIDTLVKSIDTPSRLRPHIKTCKSPEVARMMLQAGIQKFKCATIAEAEALATAGANDILLAYQPIGPKVHRFAELIGKFRSTKFSCLIDNETSASALGHILNKSNLAVDVYIDLNVGMNRTGILPEHAQKLFEAASRIKGIRIVGLHAYDGHIRDQQYEMRKSKCDATFTSVEDLKKNIDQQYKTALTIVAGGTPTYTVHNQRKQIECSPGTFVYWDKGYDQILPEQKYQFAALVVTRVISKPAVDTICVDLGHKAIASENPLQNRVYFLNDPALEPVGHSEEHMVLKTSGKQYSVGDVLYGVPHHVCPTVALHDHAQVVENNEVIESWTTNARNRTITI